MADYIVRAALAEETNDGWVWICGPSQDLASRTVVKIRRPGHCRSGYTEVRTIDDNFLRRHNDNPRISIDWSHDTIVMAEWYRRALAIRGPTKPDNKTGTVSLVVKKARIWDLRSLRAACHHPDPVVRLGTRLGMIGVWLGLLGVWLGLLGLGVMSDMAKLVGFVVLGLLACVGVWAGWGPPRPRLS